MNGNTKLIISTRIFDHSGVFIPSALHLVNELLFNQEEALGQDYMEQNYSSSGNMLSPYLIFYVILTCLTTLTYMSNKMEFFD